MLLSPTSRTSQTGDSFFLLQGTVCGLCGNFDDQTKNDFTTRDHMVVTSELDFGNSWKEASTCPDVTHTPDPCSLNPHRRSWAEKQCSIIKSGVFKGCHSKVGWLQAWEGPKGEQGHRYGWTLGMCKQVWAGHRCVPTVGMDKGLSPTLSVLWLWSRPWLGPLKEIGEHDCGHERGVAY